MAAAYRNDSGRAVTGDDVDRRAGGGDRVLDTAGLRLRVGERQRVEADHPARWSEHLGAVADGLRELVHALHHVARFTEGAAVEQPSFDGAGVLRRVPEHLTRESIRLLGCRQRRVRLAAVLIDVGARQDRSHGLGMLRAECPAPEVDGLLRRAFRRGVASGVDVDVRLVLQRHDEIFGSPSPRARKTGMSRSSSARASWFGHGSGSGASSARGLAASRHGRGRAGECLRRWTASTPPRHRRCPAGSTGSSPRG